MNSQIFDSELPQIEDVRLSPISKEYYKITALKLAGFYLVVFVALFMFKSFATVEGLQNYFWFIFIFILIFCFFNCMISFMAIRKRKYAVREHDVIYSSGLLFYKLTTVPFVRIQHIEISKSFLARQFNVATLHIYTAGESGSDLVIKGLPNDVAESLNALLSSKINEQL